MRATQPPFPNYVDIEGQPLDAGYLYFGQANQNPETSPITVYWDLAGTIPAAQPIRTLNGYTTNNGRISNVYATADYSLTVKDRFGRVQYYLASQLLGSDASMGSVETITATQGQTVFNLSNAYIPATNRLQVTINGAMQVISSDYTESSATQIIFTSGLNAGDVVLFRAT